MNVKYSKNYHYAIEAATILHTCRENLSTVLEKSGRNIHVLELDRTLLTTEQMLHYHLLNLLEKETQEQDACHGMIDIHCGESNVQVDRTNQPLSITTTTRTLIQTVEELKRLSCNTVPLPHFNKIHSSNISKLHRTGEKVVKSSPTSIIQLQEDKSSTYKSTNEKSAVDSLLFRLIVILQLCLVRINEAYCISCPKSKMSSWFLVGASGAIAATTAIIPNSSGKKTAHKIGKGLVCTGTVLMLRKGWRLICMNARLLNSSLTLEDWQQQWTLIQSIYLGENDSEDQCKRLLELIPVQKRSWSSQGTLRYNIIKWGMDTLYASVGTALKMTKSQSTDHSMLIPVTAAAASYYAFVGPSATSEKVVSGQSSDNLIRHAWGMVSLPVVKNISLHASRLLKGAAIAERITIGGVSCFVLSKDSCPALSLAIKRSRRQQKQLSLGTILEDDNSFQRNRRAINLRDYPEKDVIFHLTGGGFFAHTLAGDIPYLLDWSKATSTVVICPEYSLLPEHSFPVAIEEVTNVYMELLKEEVTQTLGFRTKHIIVTGESAGGNLAASLCVKLCMDERMFRAPSSKECDAFENIRLPDAMMLCCPVLNLSSSCTPSRIIARDAVLPSALLKVISKAYLKDHPSTDPIASPFFATDWVLSLFPPVLLFVSDSDPCTDDSVGLHSRLINVGVDSELIATHSLPHAFWGLGTAGFPEAQKMQTKCQIWMQKHLADDI